MKKVNFIFAICLTAMFFFPSLWKEMRMGLYAQGIGINATGAAPDTSAVLDVSSTTKGVLIPRVALTGTTDATTIPLPAISLLVYNTASASDVTPGYYYWNGSKWVRFVSGNGDITCNTTNFILKSDGNNGVCSQIFDNGTNVGIGTTSPQGKLHISNAYDVTGASARPNHIFLEEPNNSNLKGYIGLNLNTAAGANFEYLGIEAVEDGVHWANIILAEQGGNVGIGTAIPQAKVEIVSDNNSEFLRMNKGSGNFHILYGDNLAGVNNANGVVYFECAGSETYVMGGHTVPDGNLTRDLGSSSHIWQNLYVNDIWFNYANDWMSNILYSDRRFKKNIEPINNVLSDVMKLQAIKYDWRKDEFPDKHFDDRRHIGFIAQDVELIYPEIVNTNNEGYKSLDYSKLTPILVKAIQEQQKEMDEYKLKIKNLELEIEKIKQQLH